MTKSKAWNRLSVAAFLAAYASSPAMALPPPDESPPSTPPGFTATAVAGNQINLSWNASIDNRGVTGYYLQRCQGSCQSRFAVGTTPRTYLAAGLTPGAIYTFNVWARDAAGNESESRSAVATIAGGPPPQTDSLENQRNYVYETRLGDLNGDNLIDVYVYRVSGGTSGNGSLDQFILQQIAGGRFTTIVPTSAQTTAASGWIPNTIDKGLDDFNWDGYADIALRLSQKIPGALDQIVYAPAQLSVSTPKGTKAVDPEFKKFVRDLTNWIAKPDYLSNPPVVRVPTFTTVQQCANYCDYSGTSVRWCFNVPVFAGWTTQTDSSGFSQPALNFGQIVNQAGSGDLGPSGTSALKQILDSQLGATTGLGLVAVGADWTWWTNAERNAWLARILSRFNVLMLALMMEGDNTPQYYYHYTPAENAAAIAVSNTILSFKSPYLVFMTLTLYDSATLAYDKLAMPDMPAVGIILRNYDMGMPYPAYVGQVQPVPERGQKGGGYEWTKPSPVPTGSPTRMFNLGP